MIRGHELHSIIESVFSEVSEVRGVDQSEQLQVNCPRCQELSGLSQPDGKFNLEINTSKRMFRCWKCDEPKFSGSLRRLIRLYGSKIDYELYKTYAGSSDEYYFVNEEEEEIDVIVELPKEMILFSEMDINNTEHIEAYLYLINTRKLTREIIIRYRMGFCLEGKYARRVILPSYDENGNVNYFISRTYNEKQKFSTYLNPKADKDKIIFNSGMVNWDSTIYLVEGGFDMLSLPINTIPMLGKVISSALFLALKKYKPNIVVLLDPDAYKNSVELIYLLENLYVGCEDRVRIVKLPTNDDIDELRRNKGVDAVIDVIYTARKLVIDDYYSYKLEKPYERRNRYH